MKQIFKTALFALVLIGLNSCGPTEVKSDSTQVEIVRTEMLGDEVKTVANIEIEGMICEMACVGRVSKELEAMACISTLEMDFDPERDVDVATVTFEPNECTAENMIEAIHAIGDGSYQVKALEVVSYKQTEGSES